MRLVALALLGLVVGSVASAAPVPKQKALDNPDLAAMQGAWKLTDVSFNGNSTGDKFAADLELTMEFRGDTATTVGKKYKQRITHTVALDVNTNPRRLTMSDSKETDLDGKPVENADAKKTHAAIYKIDGDTLTTASFIDAETEVPKGFADKGVISMTYTRVKK